MDPAHWGPHSGLISNQVPFQFPLNLCCRYFISRALLSQLYAFVSPGFLSSCDITFVFPVIPSMLTLHCLTLTGVWCCELPPTEASICSFPHVTTILQKVSICVCLLLYIVWSLCRARSVSLYPLSSLSLLLSLLSLLILSLSWRVPCLCLYLHRHCPSLSWIMWPHELPPLDTRFCILTGHKARV